MEDKSIDEHFLYIESRLRRLSHQQQSLQRHIVVVENAVRERNRSRNWNNIIKKINEVFGKDGLFFWTIYQMHKCGFLRMIGKRPVKLLLFGKDFYLRTFSRDLDFAYSILIGDEYENKLRGEYDIDIPKDVDGILDLGANIGLFTAYYAKRFPDIKIIAVEPEKQNYILLRRNTRDYKNVKTINSGVWYKKTLVNVCESRVFMEKDKQYSDGAFYVKECNDNKKKLLRTVTIEELLDIYGFNNSVVKMDIEGAEKELFEEGNLDWLNRVNTLIIETHERFFNDELPIDLKIRDIMLSRRYSEELLGENKIYRKVE